MQAIDRVAAAGMISWWVEAGVDVAVSETQRDWLGLQNRIEGPLPETGRPAAPPTEKPKDLVAFQHWLATAPGLPMDRPGAIRVASHGPECAKFMLLSDLPSREDAGEGRPIGGEAWSLTSRMLAAIGSTTNTAYVASLSPFHAPGARFNGDLEACASIARDHVRLARPERLILFGDAPARALIGEPLARARGKIHRVEGVPTIATFHPRWLLQRPSDKALAWRDLLLLMSEND